MSRTTATSNSRAGSSVQVEVDSDTVNVFFDGTGNNLFNVDAFKGFSKDKQKKHIKDKTSYTSAYSNVAWLFKKGNIKNGQTWVYIDGIGTIRRGDDNTYGYGFGIGSTGVVKRAEQAFDAIVDAIDNQPSLLYINVFGFSRGAATARHFIHLAKSNPTLFQDWQLRSNQIRFKFVGLFDTVSSYGGNFNDDVDDLKLDFRDLNSSDKNITKVFHIIAGDEYRANFSITNINSAVNNGFGYEVTMNGAHSDVGGSYNKLESESYVTQNKPLKNWLLKKGFFKKSEMSVQAGRYSYKEGYTTPSTYTFKRKNIKNDIHKVSLKMMARMASKYGKLTYKTGSIGMVNYYSNTTGDVKLLMSNLPNEVINADPWKNDAKKGSRLNKTLAENANTKVLRHNYIHWSVQNSTGLGVRLEDSLPERDDIDG